MKILIRNSDNIVIYAQDDLILDNEAHGNNWRDANFNIDNATLLDATLPHLWSGAVWSYIDGKWEIVNSVRYNELVKEKIKLDIAALEASITPRRTREAILGTDNGWLADIESQIETLRSQL